MLRAAAAAMPTTRYAASWTRSNTASHIVASSRARQPLICRHASFWSRITNILSVFRGGKETPRQAQERYDLSMALLSSTHLQLRQAAQHDSNDEQLIDEAVRILEEHGMGNKGIVGLRFELQTMLEPEIARLFETFAKVDRMLLEDSKSVQDYHPDTMMKHILRDEYVQALQMPNADFVIRKRNALQTLLSFQGWSEVGADNNQSSCSSNTSATSSTDNDDTVLDDSLLDDFGYNASQSPDKELHDAIRQHQTINLCRSALVRKELGYSVVALKSTIPGAGRGVFCDGTAMAGSILAFMPGEVWPKEHLFGTEMQQYFVQDPNYQLSLRYDDICIDARRSPYTNLSEEAPNCNPWALAHICNHPPSSVEPNCRTVMVNYTERMNLDKNYIPNKYAREPQLLGPKALDREVVVMHGMALQAVRDVSNEELFYDYRLSGPRESHPKWYHVVNPQEVENRWSQS